VLAAGQQQERLIDALLMLARSQRGLERREPLDLAAITGAALRAREPQAHHSGLRVDATLEPAPTMGDRRLTERLVANLLDNALRYNVPGGRITVMTATTTTAALLSVTNTGPTVPTDQIERLLQPFQRLAADRAGGHDGFGLGLSIVAAIANAHDARLAARPAAGGGLHIEVTFPTRP
jgi:signal transduction histidine kinase